MPDLKLQRLEQSLKSFEGLLTVDDMKSVFDEFISVVKELKVVLETQISKGDSNLSDTCQTMMSDMSVMEEKLKKLVNDTKQSSTSDLKALARQLNDDIERVRILIPTLPDLSYLDAKIADLEKKIPTLPPPVILDTGEVIVDKINELPIEPDKQIDAKHVKNLPTVQTRSVFGNSRGIQLYVNGVKKGLAQFINLIPGAGISLTHVQTGNRQDITITATGGAGAFTPLVATGAIDDSNVTFTYIQEPSAIVINGAAYLKTSQVGGVNAWTWNNLTATYAFPVGSGGSTYGIV
jgi:hypothetical protein